MILLVLEFLDLDWQSLLLPSKYLQRGNVQNELRQECVPSEGLKWELHKSHHNDSGILLMWKTNGECNDISNSLFIIEPLLAWRSGD